MTEPLVVLSPHLDDAALGAAALLRSRPGAIVATVLAGAPPAGVAGEWDAACGFPTAEAALRTRRAEDRAALRALRARPVHLDRLDDQYIDGSRAPGDLVTAVGAFLDAHPGAEVAAPLGLHHPDHVDVADAAIASLRSRFVERWLVYGDYYRRTHPELIPLRVADLARRGIELRPMTVPSVTLWSHVRSLGRYRSQRGGLGRGALWRAIRSPELLWEARWRDTRTIDLRSAGEEIPESLPSVGPVAAQDH
jgi:LmbE family N-acetylglucosaminyl deacetylase